MPADLRKGPLQSSSCGADDFSKGTEGLAQEVLRGTKDRKDRINCVTEPGARPGFKSASKKQKRTHDYDLQMQ